MEYALLRSLRALGPGLVVLGYIDLFLALVVKRDAYFWELDSAKLFLAGYVVGGVYGVLASLFRRDLYAFDGVQSAILEALQKLFPELNGRSWQEVSPCFYKLIDTDKSLEQKSKGLYFNGFIVTTSFDAVWLSVFASVVGGGVALYSGEWSYLLIVACVATSSYGVWLAAVKRHRELSIGQVAVIGGRLAGDFRRCIREVSKVDLG